MQRDVQDEPPEDTLRDGERQRNQNQRRKRRHADLERDRRRSPRTVWNIATPTMMSTAAVAYGGTAATSGAMNRQGRKHRPVTTAVRPVRPPIRIPAMLSTYAVPGELPKSPALSGRHRVDDQARGADSAAGRRASSRLAACATPMNVESESNRSVIITVTIAGSERQLQRADDIELEKAPTRSPAR